MYLGVCTPEGLRTETALCSACAPHQTALHSQLNMFVGIEVLLVVLCSTRQTLSPKCIGAPRLDCTAWPHSCGSIC